MHPYVPVAPLTLPPDAAIDLQMHTTFSDGDWTAEHLLDHVAGEGFALISSPSPITTARTPSTRSSGWPLSAACVSSR